MTTIKDFITTGSSDAASSPIMCTSAKWHVFVQQINKKDLKQKLERIFLMESTRNAYVPSPKTPGVIWFFKWQSLRIKLLSVHGSYLLSSACQMLVFFCPNLLRLGVSCNLCHGKIISSNTRQWLILDRSLKHLHIGRTLAIILKPEKAC